MTYTTNFLAEMVSAGYWCITWPASVCWKDVTNIKF